MKAVLAIAAALLLSAAGLAADAALDGGVRWRIDLKGTKKSRVVAPPDAALKGDVYTVRFKVAVIDAHGRGEFGIMLDDLNLRSFGRQILVMKKGGNGIEGGTPVEPTGAFGGIRNCMFHEIVLVRSPSGIRWWFDGDELKPVAFAGTPQRRFEFEVVNANVEIAGFKTSAGDRSDEWAPKNCIVNGGFEELHGGFPVAWTTEMFGIARTDAVADVGEFRRGFRVDSSDAVEGTNSFRLGVFPGRKSAFLAECWRKRLADESYVFSCYLKSPGGNPVKVVMSALEGYVPCAKVEVVANGKWTRFEMPFRTKKAGRLRMAFNAFGEVLVDAVQLERGTKATPYASRKWRDLDRPANLPCVLDGYMPETLPAPVRPSPPPHSPRVDAKRNSYRTADGEFFPFGFTTEWAWDGIENYRKSLAGIAKYGFNCIEIPNRGFPKSVDEMRELLDVGERLGVKTIFYLAHDSKAGLPKKEPLALLKAVRNHPGFLAVGTLDEVHGSISSEQRRACVDAIRAELGDEIPIRFNEYDRGILGRADYSDCDVASLDQYTSGNHDLSYLYQLLEMLRNDNPGKAIQYYPMATGHFTADWPRDSSPAEILAQAYFGYVQGVFGTTWWTAVPLEEGVMEALSQAKRERDAINPSAFLDGAAADVRCESGNDGIKFSARERGGILAIVSVNIYGESRKAKWTLPVKAKKAEVLFESRAISVKGMAFEDTYAPYERHVYRIRK